MATIKNVQNDKAAGNNIVTVELIKYAGRHEKSTKNVYEAEMYIRLIEWFSLPTYS